MTKIDGRKATVIDNGKTFNTYSDFAKKYGYLDAASGKTPANGTVVTLLVGGPHLSGYKGITLWVVETAEGKRHIIGDNGLKIETETAYTDIHRFVVELTGTVANLATRLAAAERMIAELTGTEPMVSRPAEYNRPPFVPLTRDAVIERAKRDVAELALNDKHNEFRRSDSGKQGPFYLYDGVYGTYAEFIINRDKRTVVCLLRGYRGHSVLSRGKSQCALDDVFNTWIGRAISLRRALGLAVPDEYVNAPAPTEVRVGDIVRNWAGMPMRVRSGNELSGLGLEYVIGCKYPVIDDSRCDEGVDAN